MIEPRFLFDDIARTYARVRPGYPAALIDDLIAGAQLAPGARLLELGSGPGTATAPFVERGFSLLCIEPGASLGGLARERFAGQPVDLVSSTFEDWSPQRGAFPLVFAAQCFHWIDPAVRFVKAHAALANGGSLAIFANRPYHPDKPLDAAIGDAYAKHAPQLSKRAVTTNTVDNFRALFDDSGLFETPTTREYHWNRSYTTKEYVALLSTHSNHRMLEPAQRKALWSAIGAAIEAHGGHYEVPHVAALCYARKIPSEPRNSP